MTSLAQTDRSGPSSATAWLRERFEIGRHGGGGNLAAMEGLRGLAVLLVFCVHFVDQFRLLPAYTGQAAAWLEGISRLGHVGVDLFFVLSGYLIYGSLITRPTPYAGFMARRIRRIYPTFLVVFAVYLMLSLARGSTGKLPAEAPDLALYLAQNLLLLPGLFPIEPFIAVAWSLSYEMFFYLVAPLVIGLAAMRQWPARRRVLALLLAMAALAAWCAAFGGPVRMAMFLAGAALYEWCAVQKKPVAGSWPALLALAAAAALTVVLPDGSVAYTLRTLALCAAFFLLCACCFQPGGSALARMLSATPWRWLGNMSYSYYLIHGLSLHLSFAVLVRLMPDAVPSLPVFAGLWLLSFAFSLVPSALLFLAVERPLSLTAAPARRLA